MNQLVGLVSILEEIGSMVEGHPTRIGKRSLIADASASGRETGGLTVRSTIRYARWQGDRKGSNSHSLYQTQGSGATLCSLQAGFADVSIRSDPLPRLRLLQDPLSRVAGSPLWDCKHADRMSVTCLRPFDRFPRRRANYPW